VGLFGEKSGEGDPGVGGALDPQGLKPAAHKRHHAHIANGPAGFIYSDSDFFVSVNPDAHQALTGNLCLDATAPQSVHSGSACGFQYLVIVACSECQSLPGWLKGVDADYRCAFREFDLICLKDSLRYFDGFGCGPLRDIEGAGRCFYRKCLVSTQKVEAQNTGAFEGEACGTARPKHCVFFCRPGCGYHGFASQPEQAVAGLRALPRDLHTFRTTVRVHAGNVLPWSAGCDLQPRNTTECSCFVGVFPSSAALPKRAVHVGNRQVYRAVESVW